MTPSTRVTVLCVDDNVDVLNALRRQLRAGLGPGTRVLLADHAPLALERLRSLLADGESRIVLISDWLMPGMRGDQFVAEASEASGSLPTVVLSGHITEEATQALQQHPHVLGILPKPWDEDELLALLTSALREPSPESP